MKRVVLLGLSLAFTVVFINPAAIFAQSGTITPTPLQVPDDVPPSGISLTLSPVFLNLSTDPGKAVTSQFRVTNNNTFSEYLEISVNKFVSSDSGPVIQEADETDDFVNWVTFSEQQFRLDAQQTKTIRFTINPPEDAALGYYYGFVVRRIQDPRTQGAAISGAPALPVLLTVKSPNAKLEVQILDFKTSQPVYEYLPAQFDIVLKNSGNIHVAPSGDIFIDSSFNKEVGIIPANKGRSNVLPDSERTFTTTWDDGFAVIVPKEENGKPVKDDEGNIVYTTKYDFTKANKFRIGKYTANLVLVYDNGERDVPVEAQVSFWVIPWKMLLGAGLVLLLVVVGLTAVGKSIFNVFSKKK